MSNFIVASTLCLLVAVAEAQTKASNVAADNPGQSNPPSLIASQLQLRGTVPVMFATLVREVGLSGGVAISSQDCSRGPESSISVQAGTSVATALRQITKSKAMLEGKLRDGVANLLPVGPPPLMLQVQIRRFEWDRTTPVREVIDRLRQLPEVLEEISRLGLKEAPIEGQMSAICIRGDCRGKPKPAPELETEEGATLLSVLDRIVRNHSGSVWSYSEYHCGQDTLFSLEVLAE